MANDEIANNEIANDKKSKDSLVKNIRTFAEDSLIKNIKTYKTYFVVEIIFGFILGFSYLFLFVQQSTEDFRTLTTSAGILLPLTFLIFFEAIKNEGWKNKHYKLANLIAGALFGGLVLFIMGIDLSFNPKAYFGASISLYSSIFVSAEILIILISYQF